MFFRHECNATALNQTQAQTRAFVIAWLFTVVFYFLEYAVRSSPSVMISGLEDHFSTSALGIATILGVYYYTYSSMSLVAGAALDHLGAKRSVPVGMAILGLGCLLFSVCRQYWMAILDALSARVRALHLHSPAPSIWRRADSLRATSLLLLAPRNAWVCSVARLDRMSSD